MNKPSVAILMSTFNGELYLREQLDSILRQKNCNINLFIRDDGSTDNTNNIILEYLDIYPNIHFIQGENLGYTKSFLELLFSVPLDFDFYGFSDQDDIWLPTKIFSAYNKIGFDELPVLYACKKTFVDSNLKPLSIKDKLLPMDLYYGLFRGGLCGCVMIWNLALQEIISQYKPCSIFKSHDDYVRCLAIALACRTVMDNESLVLYRRHCNNQSLIPNQRINRIFKRGLSSLISRKNLKIICGEILQGYSNILGNSEKDILQAITRKDSLASRIYLCRLPFKTIPKYEIYILKLLILLKGIN